MAMELVCEPEVVILDEVTSGLDSDSALLCMQILSTYAREEIRTVIVVIHQPSFKILCLVDRMLILRKGGLVAWDGPGLANHGGSQEEVLERFRAHIPEKWRIPAGGTGALDFVQPGDNVADWLLERSLEMGRDEGAVAMGICDPKERRARADEAMINALPNSTGLPNPFRQFLVFCAQSLVQLTRNYVKLGVAVVLVIAAALVLGFTFRDDQYIGPVDPTVSSQCPAWLADRCTLPRVDTIPSWASMVCLAIGLTSLATSVDVFLPEWGVFHRQRRAGVNVLSYLFARNIADGLPNTFVPPLIFALVFNFFLQLNMGLVRLYVILFVTQFACLGLGYASSLVMQSAPFLAGCVFVLVSIAFCGVEPSLKELNKTAFVGFLSHFSFARWAVEALYLSEVSPLAAVYNIGAGIDALSYGQDPNRSVLNLFVLGLGFRVIAGFVYAVPFLMQKASLLWKSCHRAR